MKWLLHLITFTTTILLFGWFEWLANSYTNKSESIQTYRVVLAYRLLIVVCCPLLFFASWSEWSEGDNASGIFLLVLALWSIPAAAYILTFTITLDTECITMRHIFRQRSIPYADVIEARLRTWSGDYVIRGRDGSKIVFPTVMQGVKYILERCRPSNSDLTEV